MRISGVLTGRGCVGLGVPASGTGGLLSVVPPGLFGDKDGLVSALQSCVLQRMKNHRFWQRTREHGRTRGCSALQASKKIPMSRQERETWGTHNLEQRRYGLTVKLVALVAVPPGAVTAIFPVAAPEGTSASTLVSLITW